MREKYPCPSCNRKMNWNKLIIIKGERKCRICWSTNQAIKNKEEDRIQVYLDDMRKLNIEPIL